MRVYEEITKENYHFALGDLLVYAREKLALIRKIVETVMCSAIVFNWNEKTEKIILPEIKYIDKTPDADIDYIENKCRELFTERRYVAVLVNDYTNRIKYSEDLGKRLKQLAQELNTTVVVEARLPAGASAEAPEIEDLENQELVESADVVVLDDETEVTDKNAVKDMNFVRDNENKMIYENCFRYRKKTEEKTASLYK